MYSFQNSVTTQKSVTPTLPPMEEYLTISDVMKYCKVTRQTVYRWRQSGKLKTYSFLGGAVIRFKRADVESAWALY